MLYLKKEELNKIKDKEFSILLFYANGCEACEQAKPVFQEASQVFDKIGFYSIEIQEGLDYYKKYAELEQEIVYEVQKDADGNPIQTESGDIEAITKPQFNGDGSPKMKIKYTIPSFYVHHTEIISEDNPYGFIGGWEGASQKELEYVLQMIVGAMNEQPEEQIQTG